MKKEEKKKKFPVITVSLVPWEEADWVSADAGAVLGAGEVEGRTAAPPPRTNTNKIVHSLLHLKYLK